MFALPYIKWGLTALIPLLLYFFAPQNISPEFPLYMAFTSAAILAWAFNIFPAVGVAAMLTFAYVLFGVADAETVFEPWATVLPWLSFAAVIIGDAMEESNLAKRLALFCLKSTGGSFTGLTLGFFIAGLVLVVILPSILARCVIFCAIASGIIQALDIDPKSKMSSALILTAFFAAAAPQFMFLHSSESFIWAFDIMLKGTDKSVDFWDYCYHGTLINIVYYAVSMGCVYFVKGKEQLPWQFETFHRRKQNGIGTPFRQRDKAVRHSALHHRRLHASALDRSGPCVFVLYFCVMLLSALFRHPES